MASLPVLQRGAVAVNPARHASSIDEWVVPGTAKQILTCHLCRHILHDPVGLSTCEHFFCRHCLCSTTFHSCVQCNIPFSPTLRQHLTLPDCISGYCVRQLAKLHILCPLCKAWKSTLGQNPAHIIAHQQTCGVVLVKCDVGCGQDVLRSQLASHTCPPSSALRQPVRYLRFSRNNSIVYLPLIPRPAYQPPPADAAFVAQRDESVDPMLPPVDYDILIARLVHKQWKAEISQTVKRITPDVMLEKFTELCIIGLLHPTDPRVAKERERLASLPTAPDPNPNVPYRLNHICCVFCDDWQQRYWAFAEKEAMEWHVHIG